MPTKTTRARPKNGGRAVGADSSAGELIFEIRDAEEGGYSARALGHAIFTQAETWEELRQNVLEAVSIHFEDNATRPRLVQLHYVKDELNLSEIANMKSVTIDSIIKLL